MKHQTPASDVRRAIGLIVLGYGYIILVLVGSVWGGVALVRAWPWLFRFVTQFGFVYVLVMLGALWVRIPKPVGQRVTRAGSPKLIDEIERIARRLDAPVPDEVLIVEEFNAAAGDYPRFGIFGAPRRYLLLGLPLLDALPPDEIRAVIAHELAHLSRRHGRIRMLVGRVATSWTALAAHMATHRRYVSWLYLPFFKWFIPKLQTSEATLSRGYEYESDELAAKATDAETMAQALLRMGIQRRRLNRIFLPKLLAESAQLPAPPKDADSSLIGFLSAPIAAHEIVADIEASLAERTASDDDHPSLQDRLNKLGLRPAVEGLADAIAATSGQPGSASTLLGEKRAQKLRTLASPMHSTAFTLQWDALRELVGVWQDPAQGRKEGVEAAVAFAKWAARTQPAPQALQILREVHSAAPDDEEVSLRLAALLLEEPDRASAEEAVPILEKVAGTETIGAFAACALLQRAFLRLERPADVRQIANRENALRDARLATLMERSVVRAEDELIAAKLAPGAMRTLMAWLAANPEIVRAFLVQKKTSHFRGTPVYVVALQRRVAWYKYEGGKAGIELLQKCIEIFEVGPDADARVILVESGSSLLRRLRSIQDAVILDRLPDEKLRRVGTPPIRRAKLFASLRYAVLALFIGGPILVHLLDRSGNVSSEDSSADAESQWVMHVTPQADQFGRRFVGLLKAGETDSVARLISATAREPDSIAWASNLVRSVPHPRYAEVDRTMAYERRDGTVTRDYLGYAIIGNGDTVTVVVQTVEELGIRAVEFAKTKHGRIADPDSVGR